MKLKRESKKGMYSTLLVRITNLCRKPDDINVRKIIPYLTVNGEV
jgi:hypothetical protein